MEKVNCNFCHSGDHSLLLDIHYEHGRGSIENFRLVQCPICDLVYLNPRPGVSEMSKYYGDFYYNNLKSFGQNRDNGNSLISYYKKVRKKQSRQIRRRKANFVQKEIKKGKILDVGCGQGDFLYEMRLDGWESWGIDISDKMIEHAQNKYHITVLKGPLESVTLDYDYFDVITFWSSLEHMYDPMGCLKVAYKLLKKGGFIFIMVPNINSLEFKCLQERWPHLDIPRHLHHFSPKTLWKYVDRIDFKNPHTHHFTGLSNSHWKLLLMKSKWDDIFFNRTRHQEYPLSIKIIHEILHYLTLPFSGLCNLSGHGHSFLIYAQK